VGGPAADLRQAARDAVQRARRARAGGAGAGRLRGNRRGRHRGAEPGGGARHVRRAGPPRVGADRGEPRAVRRHQRLCYYPRACRPRRRDAPGRSRARAVRHHPARPAIRSAARARVDRRREPRPPARAGRHPRPGTCAPGALAGSGRPLRAHAPADVGRFRAVLLRMPTLAVYPGSFDPLTNGHVDIITRGARLFERIIVAVLVNAEKSPLFSMAERLQVGRTVFKHLPNVEVDTFEGLLVDYVERRGAQVIVRGPRAVSDFEFEFQMALMNQRLNGKIDTVFMMPAEQYTYISYRLIKEVFRLGGRVHGLVPDMVEERLRRKIAARAPV